MARSSHQPSSTLSSSSSSSSLRIKGYLPVRLRFPPPENTKGVTGAPICDETFFYIKEHQQGGGGNSTATNNNNSDTLFVANCPVHPHVSSKLLLQSVLGRYGDVRRVTVMAHPRQHNSNNPSAPNGDADDATTTSALSCWTTRFVEPSFMPAAALNDEPSTSTTTSFCRRDDGKFAHVVFRSHRDMKRTLRILTEIMAGNKVVADEEEQHDDDDNNNNNNAVTMDPVELQTLADVESNNDDASASNTPVLTGIRAVAARYRATGCRRHSSSTQQRAALLKECNRVMKQWEDAHAAEQRQLDVAASQPDEDGFVTVTHGGGTANALSELEETNPTTTTTSSSSARGGRQKTSKARGRKKKNTMGGADPLPDFYRFQAKDSRKRSLQDLRERFEQDLAQVKKLKEERQYQPF